MKGQGNGNYKISEFTDTTVVSRAGPDWKLHKAAIQG